MKNEKDIIEVNSVEEFEKALNENRDYTLMPFEKIMEKFNELIFELQIQEEKKIEEFKQKIKELKEKIESQMDKN
mgnify:FL=1